MTLDWIESALDERIIVALDCPADEAIVLAEMLVGHARWIKVAMTLFYAVGPGVVNTFHKLGYKVFVDLKLNDIPHQVNGAACSLASVGADLITVHASGGVDMMREALKGAEKGARQAGVARPAICAITVLTSMDDAALASVGIETGVRAHVKRLAVLGKQAGLDGVVCSPMEAADLRALLGHDALVVTPGVRPRGAALGDQSRVATPKSAFDAGASHIVIGRPVTRAADPVAAFDEIVASL